MKPKTIVMDTLLTSVNHYLAQKEPNEVVNVSQLIDYLHEIDVTAEATFYQYRRMQTSLLTTNEVLSYYDNKMQIELNNENYAALEATVKKARHVAQLSDYYSEDTELLFFDKHDIDSDNMQPMTNETLEDKLK